MAGDILPGTISFTRVGLEISPPPASESTLVVIAISKFFGDGSSPISSKINKANYYSTSVVLVVPRIYTSDHRDSPYTPRVCIPARHSHLFVHTRERGQQRSQYANNILQCSFESLRPTSLRR